MWQHDRVEIIANEQGNRTTPSYVAFTDSERLIGEAAKNQVHTVDASSAGSGAVLKDAFMSAPRQSQPLSAETI